jgi:hypothetical protein
MTSLSRTETGKMLLKIASLAANPRPVGELDHGIRATPS